MDNAAQHWSCDMCRTVGHGSPDGYDPTRPEARIPLCHACYAAMDKTLYASLLKVSQAFNQLFAPILSRLEEMLRPLDRMSARYPILGRLGRITEVLWQALMVLWIIAGIVVTVAIVITG